MNPLDWRGPQFLGFYVVTFLLATGCATVLRWLLRLPSGEPQPSELQLSADEVAYLQGGAQAATEATIARLVHNAVLSFSAAAGKLEMGTAAKPPAQDMLAAVVIAKAEKSAGLTVAEARTALAGRLDPLQRKLELLGLLVPGEQALICRAVPVLLLLLVVGLGFAKVYIGLSRERPVSLLLGLCAISTMFALAAFGRRPFRSRRGDCALKQLRQDNAALEYQASTLSQNLTGPELALAVALFGSQVLASGPMSALHAALLADIKRNLRGGFGCSSSCGSSCGGGGGCGGGCGGGGCGGCGS